MNRDQAARAFADYCLGIVPSHDPADWICRHQFLNPGFPLPPATFTPDTLTEARRRLTSLEQSFHWHLDHPTMWTAVPAPSVTPDHEQALRARFRAALAISTRGNVVRIPAVVEIDTGHLLAPPASHLRREILHFLTTAVTAAIPPDKDQYPLLHNLFAASCGAPVIIRLPRRTTPTPAPSPGNPTLFLP